MLADQQRYDFFFCPSSASDGFSSTEINYKCWRYLNGDVWWEMRRIMRPVLNKADLEVSKTIKPNAGIFDSIARLLGRCWGDVFTPSRKSAEARGDAQAVVSPKLRQEASLSTLGVFVVLLSWSLSRHRREERQKSLQSLEAWLMKVGGKEGLRRREWGMHCSAGNAALCQDRRAGDQYCVHLSRLATFSSISSWKECATLLHLVVIDASSCSSAAGLLRSLVWALANSIDRQIDSLGLPTNILKQELLLGPSGRRHARIDEDYVEHLSQRSVRRKHVHSGAQLGRAMADVAESTCRVWDESYLCKYQASSWEAFEKATIVTVCEDGARIGQPCEETQVYIAWTPDGDCAAVLPPQAWSATTA